MQRPLACGAGGGADVGQGEPWRRRGASPIHDVTAGDPLHVALFCALLATFLGSPLRRPPLRIAAACAGAIGAGALCALLTGSAELAPLAAGLGGILALAGPALGSAPRPDRAQLGRLEGSLGGVPRRGARGRW